MAMLHVLTEVIGSVELLGLVAFLEFVYIDEVLELERPVSHHRNSTERALIDVAGIGVVGIGSLRPRNCGT